VYYLLGKDDCPLCDEAEGLIDQLPSRIEFKKINITDDARLLQRYGWHIPVFLALELEPESLQCRRNMTLLSPVQIADALDNNYLVKSSDTALDADKRSSTMLDRNGRSAELFWPFPLSRLREFIVLREND